VAVEVFRLPRETGDLPLATTQTSAEGFFRLTNLPLQVALLLEAQPEFRTVSAIVTLTDAATLRKDLNPTTTLAAAVAEQTLSSGEAFSPAQLARLENVAGQTLAAYPSGDVTADAVQRGSLAAAIAAAHVGSLDIRSTPSGAQVWIDDWDTGRTTPTLFTAQIKGQSTVRLHLDGYRDFVAVVELRAGARTRLDASLEPLPAQANRAPRIRLISLSTTSLPPEGDLLTVTATVTDADSDPLMVTARLRGGGVTFAGQRMTRLEGTDQYQTTLRVPGNLGSVPQSYTVEVTATDGRGGLASAVSDPLTVETVESPPSPAGF